MFNYSNFLPESSNWWADMQGFDFGQFGGDFREMGITNPFDVTNIQSALTQAAGREVPKNMIASLTQNQIAASQFSNYRPYVESQVGTILGQLRENLSNKEAKQAIGNFAGSAASNQKMREARDIFGQKATKVLTDVGQWQTTGRRNIMETVQSWRDAAANFRKV